MVEDASKDVMSSVEPIHVAVVGGTGTGTGSGLVETPAGQPNLVIRVVTPILAIVIRFINTYLTSVVGLLTAAGTGLDQGLLPAEFNALLVLSGKIAFAGAAVGALKDTLTISTGLEKKFPLASGSV